MEWIRSKSGNDVIMLNNDAYINFGSEKLIKWVHLSFLDYSGIRRGQLLPVTLNKVKREYSKIIGKKNLIKIRSLITLNQRPVMMLLQDYIHEHYALHPSDVTDGCDPLRGSLSRFAAGNGMNYQDVQRWLKRDATINDRGYIEVHKIVRIIKKVRTVKYDDNF